MNVIAPTHHCFDNALDYLAAIVRADHSELHKSNYLLVHAICTAPTGDLYSHAWVEKGDTVIADGIINGEPSYFSAKVRDFYLRYGVLSMTKYTIANAVHLNFVTNHFGPWEECYRALCGPGRIFGGSCSEPPRRRLALTNGADILGV